MTSRKDINGWLIIDKSVGMTSAKVVSKVKGITRAKKVGHAGTLDPLASGVLPIALGEATKTIQFATDASKTYEFIVTFGKSTDTDDAEGNIIATSDVIPTKEEIEKTLPHFIGTISQIPPKYSAIKVEGKRSYDLARKGIAKELKAREITVHNLKLLSILSKTEAKFEITCEKGTYVRSIGRDLGEKLGTKAYISGLRRTKVGNFSDKSTISLEKLDKIVHSAPPSGDISGIFLPVEAVLDDIPVLDLDPSLSRRVKNGQSVEVTEQSEKNMKVCAFFEGKLLAIAHLEGNKLKPVRIFNH